MSMSVRIAIYGGTELSVPVRRLVSRLVTHLLIAYPDVVVVSGGFERWDENVHPERRDWVSVDRAVREAALAFAAGDSSLVAARLETWIPERDHDRADVRRFVEGAQYLVGKSTQARRFHLVTRADAIVTIMGEGNTATVIEMALEINRPLLPVGCTGGDSHNFWQNEADTLATRLRLSADLRRRIGDPASLESDATIDALAVDVADAMYRAAEKRCLVLMPFDDADPFYADVIEPAVIAAGYVADRIDRRDFSGDIRDIFAERVRRDHVVLVDVTGLNPNVMYELGFVHASGNLTPLVIFREELTKARYDALPFYLKDLKITSADCQTAAGRERMAEWISRFLSNRGAPVEGPAA
jgi:hypothetical protein